jgi:hypothetical protein
MARDISIFDLFSSISVLFMIIEKIIMMDPIVWIIKYFIILSAVELLCLFIMIGINEIMLSSNDIHMVIHDDEDIIIKILKIFIVIDSIIVGFIIKKIDSINWV